MKSAFQVIRLFSAFSLLELEMDGVFQKMLLLKKKKYAAITVSKNKDGTITTGKELKGEAV
jgi:DNA polymerase alpha subunit A